MTMQLPVDEALSSLQTNGMRNTDWLGRIATLCRSHSITTGDVRYLMLYKALDRIETDWNEYGAFPQSLVDEIETVMRTAIPAILEADMREGAEIAARMTTEIDTAIRAWESTW